ncbi:CMGC/DYRK/PRP4 protein kinase [Coniosporium apollinis CBS 100218]|uniref:non-specific serine/threonine protein kinase n=1 Tax=Coniosporium apollinis (strain CBS 100218) TaxID=1168221 RepID=R7YS98_CONA1|nr:CMGC/DYRK/PRP4 protein kinase [Coniosporium apollinis CBS 100218]EON64807.1 CMGC/DYRK/PRP4 protein kinase [Coniosporium apollinis CBS 100218]
MNSHSESEGEVIEKKIEKATTTLPSANSINVDRQFRNASASRSSSASVDERAGRYRSRSPYRHPSPRGEKRRRDDDFYADRADTRRFKVHYEDRPRRDRDRDENRRHRVSYADLDHADSSRGPTKNDERNGNDRYGQRQRSGPGHRTRSRSPPRFGRSGDHNGRLERREVDPRREVPFRKSYDGHGRDDARYRQSQAQSVSERGGIPSDARVSGLNAETRRGTLQQDSANSRATETSNNSRLPVDGRPGPGWKTETETETRHDSADEPFTEPTLIDEASLIEQRRRKREAIKAKYMGQATPLLVQALQLGSDSGSVTPRVETPEPRLERSVSPLMSPMTPQHDSVPSSPGLIIKNENDLVNSTRAPSNTVDADEPSAADYDPTMDMQEDRARVDRRHNAQELPATAYDETKPDHRSVLLPESILDPQPTATQPKSDFDIFAEDDDDDMFAPEPANHVTSKEPSKAVPIPQAKELDMSLLDDWDDHEGYYKIILGELIDGRYHVQTNLGKGVFSGVVRAMDSKTEKLVAIKIVRNNETMRKAGMKEIDILQKLMQADPEDKKHLIRLERSFDHKGHLCMVFENLSINLREVLKKFGRGVGINLKAVRSYAQQMFLGLSLLKKTNILHADLKPDNVLVNETRNMLKICDLGSAADASENEITSYLVSRFYRAPEIILGMPYDFAIDTWSVGCTLFELYTGQILFTGKSNNQMLRSIMECRGKFSLKMLKKANYAGMHFDNDLNFRSMEKDKITGKDVVRMMTILKPTRDLKSRLLSATKGLDDVEMKELNLFADFLDKCLHLNPEKRCTPNEALKHPFINRAKV